MKVKGYKGMNADMCCRDMQYEVGKTYHVYREIELCKNGLHFCKNLNDVFAFYPNKFGNRFFEVEADEPICGDGVKYATSTLTIVNEINSIEVNRAYYSDGDGDGEYGYNYDNGYGYSYDNGYGYSYDNGYGNGGYGDRYGGGHGNGYGNGDSYGRGGGYGNTNIQRVLIFN